MSVYINSHGFGFRDLSSVNKNAYVKAEMRRSKHRTRERKAKEEEENGCWYKRTEKEDNQALEGLENHHLSLISLTTET